MTLWWRNSGAKSLLCARLSERLRPLEGQHQAVFAHHSEGCSPQEAVGKKFTHNNALNNTHAVCEINFKPQCVLGDYVHMSKGRKYVHHMLHSDSILGVWAIVKERLSQKTSHLSLKRHIQLLCHDTVTLVHKKP